MPDIAHVLMAAGLDAVTAEEIQQTVLEHDLVGADLATLPDRFPAFFGHTDTTHLARQARLAWWSADHIPFEFKRLLDARRDPSAPPDEEIVEQVSKAWDEMLEQMEADGALQSPVAFEALARLAREVDPGTKTLHFAPKQLQDVTEFYRAESATPTAVTQLVKAYLEAVIASDNSGEEQKYRRDDFDGIEDVDSDIPDAFQLNEDEE
jgi:hypothetical protein